MESTWRRWGMAARRTVMVLGTSMVWGFAAGALAAAPPWAVGEQPTFRGVLEGWTEADAIAAAAGDLVVTARAPGREDSEAWTVGSGRVEPDGTFVLELIGDATGTGAGGTFSIPECPELQPENPQQLVTFSAAIHVPELYQEGAHARPGGIIRIGDAPFSFAPDRTTYEFVYASADGAIRGSCDLTVEADGDAVEAFVIRFDLDLHRGWNSLRFDEVGLSGWTFTTAPIPADATWQFVNPLSMGSF